jgi:hypothetical protein
VTDYKATLDIPFRLPLGGRPRAIFQTDYLYEGGRLLVDGACVLEAASRAALEEGVSARFAEGILSAQLATSDEGARLLVKLDDIDAIDERDVEVRATRWAYVHAFLALGGSFAGFVASWLYLQKAASLNSAWALKMGQHTAGWHLLLTLTLFPGSIWGGRIGIRIVQCVCVVFFAIHLAIAIANVGRSDPTNPNDPTIAAFNALSGVLFLVAGLVGNRAHRDMDPALALARGA